MKGRVAVLQKYGGDFDLREYPVPDPEPRAVLFGSPMPASAARICTSGAAR
jgi:hypothetical protein